MTIIKNRPVTILPLMPADRFALHCAACDSTAPGGADCQANACSYTAGCLQRMKGLSASRRWMACQTSSVGRWPRCI